MTEEQQYEQEINTDLLTHTNCDIQSELTNRTCSNSCLYRFSSNVVYKTEREGEGEGEGRGRGGERERESKGRKRELMCERRRDKFICQLCCPSCSSVVDSCVY